MYNGRACILSYHAQYIYGAYLYLLPAASIHLSFLIKAGCTRPPDIRPPWQPVFQLLTRLSQSAFIVGCLEQQISPRPETKSMGQTSLKDASCPNQAHRRQQMVEGKLAGGQSSTWHRSGHLPRPTIAVDVHCHGNHLLASILVFSSLLLHVTVHMTIFNIIKQPL